MLGGPIIQKGWFDCEPASLQLVCESHGTQRGSTLQFYVFSSLSFFWVEKSSHLLDSRAAKFTFLVHSPKECFNFLLEYPQGRDANRVNWAKEKKVELCRDTHVKQQMRIKFKPNSQVCVYDL